MSRRKIPWLAILITLPAVSLCWWVYATQMEWRDVTISSGPSTLARENVLLASTRLLNKFGYSTEQVQDISFFDDLGSYPEDIIWLYRGDALVDETSFNELESWTANGGHLILGLNNPIPERLNTMLARFNLRVVTDPDLLGRTEYWRVLYEANKPSTPESGYDYTTPPHPGAVYSAATPRFGSTRITRRTKHTVPQALTIQVRDKAEIFTQAPVLDGIRWPFAKGKPDAYINVQIPYENGIVTVLGDADMFSNTHLQTVDNSAYLLELMSVGPSKTVHYLIEERNTPGLPGTLWRLYPATVSLLALALLAWVLSAASRLGPIRTELTHGRTNLISHLRARGHFWRRRGNVAPMTEPVRLAALREVKRQYPRMSKTLDTDMPDSLVIKLSEDFGCSVKHVQKALSPEPLSARDLPDAALVLQSILHPTVPASAGTNKASL